MAFAVLELVTTMDWLAGWLATVLAMVNEQVAISLGDGKLDGWMDGWTGWWIRGERKERNKQAGHEGTKDK